MTLDVEFSSFRDTKKTEGRTEVCFFCLVWFSLKVLFYFHVSAQLQKFPDYDLLPAVLLLFKEDDVAGRMSGFLRMIFLKFLHSEEMLFKKN